MKAAFTLLETLIALVVASILFATIFNLTELSLRQGHEIMRLQIKLNRELAAIADFDERRLLGQTMPVPSFLVEPKIESWGITAESPLGYRGVMLP